MTMPSTPAGDPPPAAPPQMLRFEHHLTVRELLPIVIVNALLNIVTLTIYRFWAKTRVRRQLWSGMRLLGDRFEYTGTGKELFFGFLIVLFVVLLPLGAIFQLIEYLFGLDDPVRHGASVFLIYLLILFLIGMAIWRAQRYRLSRTVWRGIRPALSGKDWHYALMYLAIFLANGATLGWSYPWGRLRLMEQMLSHTYFGDRQFSFSGSAKPLYKRFAIVWFGGIGTIILLAALVTGGIAGMVAVMEVDLQIPDENNGNIAGVFFLIGIVSIFLFYGPILLLFAFYKAREFSYIAECTRFEGLTFRFNATFGSLIRLVFGNFLIIIFTLTLGQPFAQLRNFRFFCSRLQAVGAVDFEAIQQSAQARPSVGEGLADAFDVGSV